TTFRARLRTTVWFGITVVAVYICVAVLPQPMRWWHHARFVVSPHAPTKIPLSVAGEMEIFRVTLAQLAAVFTLPVLALCAAGALALFRSGRARQFWILALPLLGYYVVVIAKTRVAYPRFMMPFMFPVAVLAVHGVAWIGNRLQNGGRWVWTGVLSLLLLYSIATGYVPVTYAQTCDLKRQLTADLPSILAPGSPLLLSYMQSYNFPNAAVY